MKYTWRFQNDFSVHGKGHHLGEQGLARVDLLDQPNLLGLSAVGLQWYNLQRYLVV